MNDFFELVAHRMKASYSAGSLNSYEQILDALHRRFGNDETALRAYLESLLDSIAPVVGQRYTVEDFLTGALSAPGKPH